MKFKKEDVVILKKDLEYDAACCGGCSCPVVFSAGTPFKIKEIVFYRHFGMCGYISLEPQIKNLKMEIEVKGHELLKNFDIKLTELQI